MASSPYDIAVVDNLDVVRRGVSTLALTHPRLVRSVATYSHPRDVDLLSTPPRVVVLDYWLGREDEPSTPYIQAMKEWSGRVVLYTSEIAPAPLRTALELGVDGLSLKIDGLDALAGVIAQVAEGQAAWSGPIARAIVTDEVVMARLTPREIQVVRALASGLSVPEIAELLGTGVNTVKRQVETAKRRFADVAGVRLNAAGVIREATRDGYVGPARPGNDSQIG